MPARTADAPLSRLGCNSSSVEEMLGNQGVTESNMMQYLGIIEQRTSEILQMYAASQANMAGTDSVVHSIQNGIVQPAAPRLSVMPPAWEDFSSGEESDQEDDERPLTREELQRKTLRGMGKKEVRRRANYHLTFLHLRPTTTADRLAASISEPQTQTLSQNKLCR